MAAPKTGNIQVRIQEAMEAEGKTTLWTKQEIMDTLGLEERPAANALYNAWRFGKIMRHKDKDDDGNHRYALSIKEGQRLDYVPTTSTGAKPGGTRKKKSNMITAKELRKLFAAHMNSTAQIEDIVLGLADRLEELEKSHEKIKQLI